MNSYIEIDRLFGTPLNQVPKPKVPFKIKTWHIITVGAIAIAAVYGVYTFCNDVKSKFKRKDIDDDSSKFNFKKQSYQSSSKEDESPLSKLKKHKVQLTEPVKIKSNE